MKRLLRWWRARHCRACGEHIWTWWNPCGVACEVRECLWCAKEEHRVDVKRLERHMAAIDRLIRQPEVRA